MRWWVRLSSLDFDPDPIARPSVNDSLHLPDFEPDSRNISSLLSPWWIWLWNWCSQHSFFTTFLRFLNLTLMHLILLLPTNFCIYIAKNLMSATFLFYCLLEDSWLWPWWTSSFFCQCLFALSLTVSHCVLWLQYIIHVWPWYYKWYWYLIFVTENMYFENWQGLRREGL